jgi:RNA polymerase sigma factor (sigma-70 family)
MSAGEDRDEAFIEAYPALFLRASQAAFRVTGDAGVAEELAQETMIRAYTRWSRLDDRRVGWVVTTAVRLAIDRWRREQRRPRRVVSDPIPELDAVAAQRVDLVRSLAALPRRQREVAVLRYLEDQPEREVAQMLGCSVGSVKRHAARASAALRAALEPPAPITEAP